MSTRALFHPVKQTVPKKSYKQILSPSRASTALSPVKQVAESGAKVQHKLLSQRLVEFRERRLNPNVSLVKSGRLLRGFSIARKTTQAPEEKLSLLSSQGAFKKSWESAKTILLVYTFVYHPLKMLVFREASVSATMYAKALDYAVDFFFLLDIVLNFVIRNRQSLQDTSSCSQVVIDYFSGFFLLDWIAILPYETIYEVWGVEMHSVNPSLAEFLRIAQLLKLLRLVHLFRIITNMKAHSSQNFLLERILQILEGSLFGRILPSLLLIVFLMHLFACIWLYIGQTGTSRENWLTINKMYDANLFDRYTYSFYLVVQTFTTVGYGDVKSTLIWERGIRMVGMLVGVLVYNMFSGQVVNYQSEQHLKSDELDIRRQKLLEIAKQYQIPERVKLLVLDSLEDMIFRKSVERKPELSYFDQEIQDDLHYQVFLKQFERVPMFSACPEHRNFVLELGRSIKVVEFEAEKVIFQQGEPSGALFIIASGEVEVMCSLDQTLPVCRIKKGFFGEIELLQSESRRFTLQSRTHSVLLCLRWDRFKEILMRKGQEGFYQQLRTYSLRRWNRIDKMNEKMISLLRRDQLQFNHQVFFAPN